MKEKNGKKGKESKERILEVALSIFMRKGFQGSSLSAIAGRAKVTKGGIYHYFASKEDLYRQVLESYFLNCRYPSWIEGAGTLPVKEFIHQGFISIKENKKSIQTLVGSNKDDAILYLYTFLYEATRKYPEFQKSIDTYDDYKIAILKKAFVRAQKERAIRGDLDPELLAFELDNYLQQLQYMKFVNPVMKANDDMLEKLFQNYWKRLVD